MSASNPPGITGIGKTALAERLAVELQDWFSGDWKNKFKRANFDYEDKAMTLPVSLLDG
jgi:hypothetical protein